MKRHFIALLVFASATSLLAWGEAGHYLVNEAATRGLPNDMPPFFYAASSELIHLAYDPDRWRGAGESLDAVNPPDHFLDYEYVNGLKLSPDRFKYLALLTSSGTLRRHGITNSTPGFLPWRIAELSERLTALWRLWRKSDPGSVERTFIERDIIHTAGILGHFIGDASQPLHTTYNYNGWVLPNPEGFATDCDTHARFETDFVSHAIAVGDVVPSLGAPVARTEYFNTALDFIRRSNQFVEPLYRLDQAGAFRTLGPTSQEGKTFASERLASGASMLRDYWWSTWLNSARPPAKRIAATPAE